MKTKEFKKIIKKSKSKIKRDGYKSYLSAVKTKIKNQGFRIDNVPKLSPLTEDEELTLEKKMVWVFSAPRSGSTWLGGKLLQHPENIIWYEPWIGFHLAAMAEQKQSENDEPKFERVYDENSESSSYFFSPTHKKNWMPALRKFILTRAYSESQTLSKNIIIKEPVGSQASDILMECFSNSKLIFLIRDGRDVVDSRIDMHRKNSWAGLKSINTPILRKRLIRWYSFQWNKIIERIYRAYENHNSKNRMLVKYEDLKKDPVIELKKIYDFLEIKIEEKELEKIVSTYDFKNIPDSEKGKGKFTRTAKIGGWMDNFSKEEQDLMISIMGKTLGKFGYRI